MRFEIDGMSRLPIYQQLARQAREGIARGEAKPGERLPSVRQLSRDLVVNPNTVARAYTELEREGLLVNQPGRGVFVAAPRDELTDEARRRRIEEEADRLLTSAVHLGFSKAEVVRVVSERARRFRWASGKSSSNGEEGRS